MLDFFGSVLRSLSHLAPTTQHLSSRPITLLFLGCVCVLSFKGFRFCFVLLRFLGAGSCGCRHDVNILIALHCMLHMYDAPSVAILTRVFGLEPNSTDFSFVFVR